STPKNVAAYGSELAVNYRRISLCSADEFMRMSCWQAQPTLTASTVRKRRILDPLSYSCAIG
ncbi:MAG TPA: hypothetical protein VG711_04145, partial [Phycisphaerales bacterium]|nr:hypothetical protein [Phycisphaerales bacterium]